MGLGIKLGDAAEGGTTGCFGSANLVSADLSFVGCFLVEVFVVFVVVVVVVAVVALVGGDWKTFGELKVEVERSSSWWRHCCCERLG